MARPGVYEVPFGPTLRELLDLAGGVAGTGNLQAVLLGGVAGRFVGPEALDTPLTFEGARRIGASLGSGVVLPLDDTVDLRPLLVRIAGFFRDESCGQCVPCRVGTVRQQEVLVRLSNGADVDREVALLDEVGRCMRDASICGLGQTAYDAIDSAVRRFAPFGGTTMPELEVDGQTVVVHDGSTILDACRRAGIDVPTLCFGETLAPKNACRICVVELDGSRVLVPACSRAAEDGMVVRTQTDRTAHARKVVLELLASTAELDWAPNVGGVGRRVRSRARAVRSRRGHFAPARDGRQRPLRPRLRPLHPLLQVRRRVRGAVAEHVRHLRRRPGVRRPHLDRMGRGAARLGLRVLRQLHRGVPHGRAHARRSSSTCATRALGRDPPDVTTTICAYCGVGCNLELHVQDNQIVKVTSPEDHSITHGNLCIKGRFGFTHVQDDG